MLISAVVFAVVAALLCVAAVLAVLGITHVHLSGADAVERDGLPRAALAPAWALTDPAGRPYASPPSAPLQLVVFTDHSLKSFPSVAAGLREAMAQPAPPQIVILTRGHNEMAGPALRLLGLSGLPVLTGSPALYGRYNVRVTPFAIVVDAAGRVRASSLVNHDWQVTKLIQLGGIELDPAELPAPPRSRRSRRFRRPDRPGRLRQPHQAAPPARAAAAPRAGA